jgi:hypothetical protein
MMFKIAIWVMIFLFFAEALPALELTEAPIKLVPGGGGHFTQG